MAAQAPRRLLLTGAPGCGKTTVVMAVVRLLRQSGQPAFGFWTQEVRRAGVREGFELEVVSGSRAVLASVRRAGPPLVGRYGVDTEVMDRLVVPEIERAVAAAKGGSRAVLVMDEIGKMELFSIGFQQAVSAAFESRVRILATIMAKPHPVADALKRRSDAYLVTVTPHNRDGLPTHIAQELQRP